MNDSKHLANHDTIDRVLASLRDVEAPAGMDQRILAAMHQRADGIDATARTRIFAKPLFWLVATAAGIVAVALWWTTPPHPTRNLATANTPTTATSHSAHVADSTPPPAHTPRSAAAAQPATKTHSSTTPETAAPASDTLAASHPAPPLPLTQQEQLLLRIVHKGDPIELASLNNDFRDHQPTRDAEDFQRFFKPPVASHPADAQPSVEAQATDGAQPTQQDTPNSATKPEPEPNDIPQQ